MQKEEIMKAIDRKLIGKNLQSIRKAAGFRSAAAFAEFMGYNLDTYTCYEQGKSMFSYEQAWDMADALGVTLDALGGREFPSEPSPASPDERALVDSYRRMDDGDKPGFMSTARALAYAGDAKRRDMSLMLSWLGTL